MHEYHTVESAIAKAIERARGENATRIKKITLVVGELTGFDEGSIRLCFEGLAGDEMLSGAELIIRKKVASLRCNDCGISFEKRKGEFRCRACLSENLTIEAGKEFYIDDIEIETAQP